MPLTPQLLIADDDDGFRHLVRTVLEDAGYQIHEAADGQEALDCLHQQAIGVVLLDLSMPKRSGMEVLAEIMALDEAIETVVVSGNDALTTAVEAMRLGAYHYLTKPVNLDDLTLTIARAFEKQQACFENRLLRAAIRHGSMVEPGMPVVAASASMRALFNEAQTVAAMDAPVLINGETGAGKEVVAAYIHRYSRRADGPFNVINCGALSESLIDAEFFGHVKGAFTGAEDARPGIIEVSHGGTLLLDEIGDLAASAQTRLLRVLEYGVVRRVGATKEIPVDVRILAATHYSMEALVASGRFREDLYHGLVVINLRIPALRERQDDIVPLACFFLDEICSKYGDSIGLGEDCYDLLRDYPWLGNVRELRNVIERAWFASLRDGARTIHAQHLRFLRSQGDSDRFTAHDHQDQATTPDPALISLREIEQRHITRVLEHCAGNRRQAADILGISERSLYRRLQEWEQTASV